MKRLHYLRNGWTAWHALAAVAMVAAGAAATFTAWHDIYRIARKDEEHIHIFLVPLVAAWLVWVRRQRLRDIAPKHTWVGPLVVLAGWALFSLGDMFDVLSFWYLGAIVLPVGCLVSVVGTDPVVKLLPAFGVLLFLVPVPGMVRQQIAIPLQTATAQVTELFVDLLGVPIERSGNMLSINGVDVAIAEACNGLRMIFAVSLVCYAFAFGTPLRPYVRALVIAASPFAAILCNVIRLIPTVWVYGNYSLPTAERFHDFSGWIMLPLAFMILLGIVRLLRWALIPVTPYTLAYD